MQQSQIIQPRHTALTFAAIAVLALGQRQLVMATPDVAWLLTVAEKVIDGALLYVDVLETNPPASVWLYLPFAWLGRMTGLRAEVWIDLVFIAASALSACALRGAWKQRGLDSCAFATLVLLPAACFGEREHAALILYLPVMALASRRVRGQVPSTRSILAAALLIGAIACIKPHFVIVIVTTYLAAAIRGRTWRVLLAPEALLGALLFGLYVGSTFVFYPAFWSQMLPISNLLYIPARVPILAQLYGAFPVVVAELAVIAAYAQWKRLRAWRSTPCVLAAAGGLGFLIVALVQGKGWPYHYYPPIGLAMLIAASCLLDDLDNRHGARLFLGSALALLCVQFWMLFNSGLDLRPFYARLRAVDPHPRMASLASDFALGFPAVRALDGIWIGRSFSRWIPYHAKGLAQTSDVDRTLLPRFDQLERADIDGFIEDLQRGRPTLILAERRPFDFVAWAQTDPRLASLLACYEVKDRILVGSLDTPQSHGLDVELLHPRAGMTEAQWRLGCATLP